jgi:predicted ABC-type transport system involved in lysophospholipase L1 biosynthesis ATPase subunit
MIEFHDFAGRDFRLEDAVLQPGTENLILVDTAEQLAEILNCMAGLRAPALGSVLVFGRNLSELPRDEQLQAVGKLGIVPHDGGLLTVLPGWKNVLLPRHFQPEDLPAGIAEEFEEAVRFCGAACESNDEWLRLLPDYLSPYQRRIAAFLRLMLGRPSICIYENLTGNLPGRQKQALLALTRRYHGQQPGRISVYLEFDAAFLAEHWTGAVLRGIPRGPSLSNPTNHADAPDLRISIAPF